jgi:TldD protein
MKIMTHARIMLLSLLVASLLSGFAVAHAAVAQPAKSDGKDDVVLSAMREELERSKSQLKMDQVAAPYYIEYRISDVDEYSAEASFGALRGDVRVRFRFIRVVVRIGDYKQDSYVGPGEGTRYFMPVDDDITALRHQLPSPHQRKISGRN